MNISKENKESYLANPNHCPFCGSDNVSADYIEGNDTLAFGFANCGDCGKKWKDIYNLVAVEPFEVSENG